MLSAFCPAAKRLTCKAAPPLSQKSRCAAIFGSPVILKRACSTDQEVVCLSPAAQTKTRHSGCRFSTSWSLTSSERACAVSILPCGKTLDLQGCSSSFPKISLRCDFREPCILKRACSTDQEVADATPAARQHKTPQKVNLLRRFVVEVTGLEPTTSWSLTKRATKLRYTSVLPFKNSIIYYT